MHAMDKKINILFVEYCADLKAGGAQRVFLNILKSLNNNKYNIFAAFPVSRDGGLVNEVPEHVSQLLYDSKSPDGTHNKLWAYFIFLIFMPVIIFRWCYVLKRKKIKIVYVHSIISGFHFSLVKCLIDFKLIYHEHNMASQRPKTFFWRWLFDFVALKSDKIIAISKDVADSLIDFGAQKEKVSIIHNGIEFIVRQNDRDFRAKGFQRLGIEQADESLLVGMIGHFRPWKGQQIFIESLKTVLDDHQAIHYVLIGGVQDQDYYQHSLDYINKNNLSERITLTGYQDDIPELMSCLDIVVVPSVPEPFGLVLLEAMMMSKPIVAFNLGGPAEIISHENTGILVDDIDARSLGLAISKLVGRPDTRDQLGINGRRRLEEKFTNNMQCQKIERLIDGF
jgi:glycosyltransferase involved in cell wall biosynthesis